MVAGGPYENLDMLMRQAGSIHNFAHALLVPAHGVLSASAYLVVHDRCLYPTHPLPTLDYKLLVGLACDSFKKKIIG